MSKALTADTIKQKFGKELKNIVVTSNNDFLERGIRFCRKDGKLFLGGRDDYHGNLFLGEPQVGTATETAFGGCPDDSENGHVGIGCFHVHPSGTSGPSPADLTTFGHNAQSRKYPSIMHWDDRPYGKSEIDCIADSKGEMLCVSGVDRSIAAGYFFTYMLGGDQEMADCMQAFKKKHPDACFDIESGVDIDLQRAVEAECADPFFERYAKHNGITITHTKL